jgi:aldose 1-epimerase
MLLTALLSLSLATHSAPLQARSGATVTRAPFGRMPDGAAVEVYTLTNPGGTQVKAITYGAIIQAIRVPDKAGRTGDVTLGYDSLEGYLTTSPYFGAVVGRYANRIAHGRFTLGGRTYRLATNNGPNHLHGGVKGFDKVVWADTPARSEPRSPIPSRRPTR